MIMEEFRLRQLQIKDPPLWMAFGCNPYSGKLFEKQFISDS